MLPVRPIPRFTMIQRADGVRRVLRFKSTRGMGEWTGAYRSV